MSAVKTGQGWLGQCGQQDFLQLYNGAPHIPVPLIVFQIPGQPYLDAVFSFLVNEWRDLRCFPSGAAMCLDMDTKAHYSVPWTLAPKQSTLLVSWQPLALPGPEENITVAVY